MRSPLWDNIPEGQREALYRQVGDRLLTGKVGEVDEIAEAYLFLMRESFATGQVVRIDGGATLV